MKGLFETQLFQAFIQTRAEVLESKNKEASSDIKLFDEEIVAKKNRSAMRKKLPTPFLNDASMNISGMFIANPPNNSDFLTDSMPMITNEIVWKN